MSKSSAVEITVDRVAVNTPIQAKTLPGWYPALLFAGLAIAFYLIFVSFNSLPTQLQTSDEVCSAFISCRFGSKT